MPLNKPVTNDNLTFEPEEQYSWSDDPKQLAMAQHPAESTAVIFHQRERWRIWKNIFLISFSFMCLFTAFQSTSNLQSSINGDDGLGTASLTAIYLALLISCLLLPSLVMKKLTCKWTMVTCTFCYVGYVVAQFYPRLYTLIPAGILVGLGGAPLWAAKCTYLTQAGMIYADITKQDAEPVIVKFFGLFFLLFQFSQVIGNLISSILLQPEHDNFSTNLTMETIAATCGANFCAQSAHVVENSNLDRPPESKLFVLTSTFLVLAILSSLVIAFFVDNLKRYGEAERSVADEELGPLQLLSATAAHLKKPYQLLIIPLTMWSGFEQAFITADFTKGYIACACGVHQIGLVLIVYGVCDAVCSISFGFVIKKIGRVPIFLFGAMINFAMIGIMLTWTPNPEEFHMFFVIAALWGIADAVWQTQINAFYGVIFPMTPEAAFSNYRLWESLGFTIQFAYSGYICISVKMYILIAVLSVGMLGYMVIEICEWKREVAPDEEEDSY